LPNNLSISKSPEQKNRENDVVSQRQFPSRSELENRKVNLRKKENSTVVKSSNAKTRSFNTDLIDQLNNRRSNIEPDDDESDDESDDEAVLGEKWKKKYVEMKKQYSNMKQHKGKD